MYQQREVKFKIWNKLVNNWLDPVRNAVNMNGHILRKGYQNVFVELLYDDKDNILLQFTGLRCKDRKEIYEGDIIEQKGKRFICRWSDVFGFCFVEINKNLGTFPEDGIVRVNHNRRSQFEIHNSIKYYELIGNMFDNPELLK